MLVAEWPPSFVLGPCCDSIYLMPWAVVGIRVQEDWGEEPTTYILILLFVEYLPPILKGRSLSMGHVFFLYNSLLSLSLSLSLSCSMCVRCTIASNVV